MSPPDLPCTLGLFMALGAAIVIAGFAAMAFNLYFELSQDGGGLTMRVRARR